MTDPLRSDRPVSAADLPERDRDAHVEQLLLAGLDHYFAGEHELAISVWTRVLFLNHGHARARAYIERARSAISERQRESEELLHTGVEAFGRGDIPAARRLLRSAVDRGGATEEVLALLDRLGRLEAAGAAVDGGSAGLEPVTAPTPHRWPADHREPSRTGRIAAGAAALVLVGSAAAWLWLGGPAGWLVQATVPTGAAPHDSEPLDVPSPSEAALSRARTLQVKGRLHEALLALDDVRRGDASWPQAQQLRAAIQRQLLSGAGVPLSTDPAPGPDARR
jgi:hypothetical protein